MGMRSSIWQALAASAGAAVTIVAQASPAHAQEQTYRFEIPAQDLGAALREFARVSRRQVIFDADLVRARRSPALVGSYGAREAIERLLAGSGLVATQGAGGIFMVSQPASSAAAGTSAAAELPSQEEGTELLVTGTRIRGVDVAAPSLTITREQIDRTGYATVEEIFEDLPQNLNDISSDAVFATGASRLSTTNTQGAVGISLRGLGPESTLVLFNGTRRPGNVFGRVVDISAIPLAVVERVEIVTGGRSAIYGSDAVAGVVNLVTRREFDGAETQAYFGWSTNGGERLQLSQVAGTQSDRGGLVLAYDFTRGWRLDHQDTGLVQPSPFGLVPGRFDLQPDSRRHSVFASGRIDLTPGIELRGDGLYTNDLNENFASFSIPGVFTNSQSTRVRSEQYSGSVGIRADLGSEWALDISGTHGAVRNRERYVSPGGTAGGDIVADLTQIVAVADGPLFAIGPNVARGAIGVEYRHEGLERTSIAGARTLDIDRDVKSAFAELVLPFELDSRGDHMIEISLAGRYDDYSDFGDTFNPQAGIVWQPVRGLKFRAAYSRAFRAPSFSDLTIDNQAVIIPNPDPVNGGFTPVLSWLGGNPDLQPERATTWSLGFDYVPAFAPQVRLSGSYFNIRYRQRIEEPSADIGSVLLNEALFAGLVDRTPSAAELQAILASAPGPFFQNFTGVPFDPATQDLLTVFPNLVLFDNRRNNIGLDELSGLDLTLDARVPAGAGELSFGLNGTYYLDFDRQNTATSPTESLLDRPGRPVDLRFRANAGWRQGPFGIFTYLNYTDGYRDTFRNPPTRIDSWTTVDVTFRFEGSRLANPGFLDGVTLAASIDNLFSADPPVFLSNTFGLGYDPANANARGRFFGLRATKRW